MAKMKKPATKIGDRYYKWTVVSPGEDRVTSQGYRDRVWNCCCDCSPGIIHPVLERSLRAGVSKSCGCLQKEAAKITGHKNLNDLVGRRFGRLLVVSRAADYIIPCNGGIETMWNCICDCGTHVTMRRGSLITGSAKSCGCLRSNGEIKVSELLNNNNISFKKEYTFKDLRGPKGGALRYDFGILNESNDLLYLVEYDGAQHFEKEQGSWEPLNDVQKRDQLKNNYCLVHNIPLIRIPFTHINITIEDLRPETSRFLVA